MWCNTQKVWLISVCWLLSWWHHKSGKPQKMFMLPVVSLSNTGVHTGVTQVQSSFPGRLVICFVTSPGKLFPFFCLFCVFFSASQEGLDTVLDNAPTHPNPTHLLYRCENGLISTCEFSIWNGVDTCLADSHERLHTVLVLIVCNLGMLQDVAQAVSKRLHKCLTLV